MIMPNSTIGYIRKILIDGKEQFEYIETKVKVVYVGKEATKVYTDRFRLLDIQEIESNTKWLNECKTLILVTEPFITSPDLAERCKRFVEKRNEVSNNE